MTYQEKRRSIQDRPHKFALLLCNQLNALQSIICYTVPLGTEASFILDSPSRLRLRLRQAASGVGVEGGGWGNLPHAWIESLLRPTKSSAAAFNMTESGTVTYRITDCMMMPVVDQSRSLAASATAIHSKVPKACSAQPEAGSRDLDAGACLDFHHSHSTKRRQASTWTLLTRCTCSRRIMAPSTHRLTP